jgi:hypothetical protein
MYPPPHITCILLLIEQALHGRCAPSYVSSHCILDALEV